MNLPHQDRQAWQLRLFGRFSLVSPSGETVRLPDYKTEGLLAILALNRELGVPRQDAANILWPRREPSNLTNLRQAISMLRRALGDSALSVTAKHCRLADGIDCISDYDHPEVRESGGFMPGHEGDWFEQIRLESIEPEGHEPSPIVDHFLQSLQWFAQNDPRGMYAILGATPSMARSLPF